MRSGTHGTGGLLASVFVSYSSHDREFAERLARDLYRQSVEVWMDEWRMHAGDEIGHVLMQNIAGYDYFCIILSPRSVGSDWVLFELETALQKEQTRSGGLVVPIVHSQVDIPTILGDRDCMDFASDYDRGFASLIDFLAAPQVRTPIESRLIEVGTARRGTRTRLGVHATSRDVDRVVVAGSDNRMGTLTIPVDPEEGTGVTVLVESIGESTAATQLTGEMGELVTMLYRNGVLGGGAGPMTQLFRAANLVAREVNAKHGLEGNLRVSSKMAVVMRLQQTVYVAAIGTCGIIRGVLTSAGNYEVLDATVARHSIDYTVARDSDHGGWARAPLGYILDDSLEMSPQMFEINEGEYFGITTFPMPYAERDVAALRHALSKETTATGAANALTSWHVPPLANCMTSVLSHPLQRHQ